MKILMRVIATKLKNIHMNWKTKLKYQSAKIVVEQMCLEKLYSLHQVSTFVSVKMVIGISKVEDAIVNKKSFEMYFCIC